MQETTRIVIDPDSQVELIARDTRAWEYIMRKQRERAASGMIIRKVLVYCFGALMFGFLVAAIILSSRG